MPRFFRSSAGACGAAAAVVATVLGYFPAPALAQTADILRGQTAQATRAEEDRASREAKATRLVPEQRSKIEAVLYRIDEDLLLQRIFNPPRGIHARVGGIGEGGGFGGGPGYQFIGVPFDLRTSAAASLKGYFIAEGSLRFPGTQSEDLYTWANGPYVEVYARWRDSPQEDFYGLGPGSLEDDRSNFAQRETFVRVTPAVRRGYLTAGVNLGYLDPSIGSGTDTSLPSTDEIFAPEEVPGLDAQPAFGVIEPFVEFATFDRAIDDRAGGRYRVTFTRYADRDLDQFSFNRWDVDLRQFIPFVHDTHTLALRAWASSSEPSDGDSVPFYLQPTLGGSRSLRGIPDVPLPRSQRASAAGGVPVAHQRVRDRRALLRHRCGRTQARRHRTARARLRLRPARRQPLDRGGPGRRRIRRARRHPLSREVRRCVLRC